MGAGHIGCYVGARLAQASGRVQMVGRPRVLLDIRQHGLAYSDYLGGAGRAPMEALTLREAPEPVAADTLVLVCVKSGATADAGAALAPCLLPGTLVLSLQNGVRNAAVLQQLLPTCTVLPVMVPFNVVPLSPGRFHQATQGRLEVQAHDSLAPWQPLFLQAGLALTVHADLAPVQWGKLLINLGNPINALSGLPVKAMLMQRDFRRCMALAQAEALAVMRTVGIAPVRMTPLPPKLVPLLLRLPNALFLHLAQRMLEVDPHARSSMSDDLEKGRVSEVDYINGEIVRLAESKGLTAPVNARLVALMRQAEAGGQRQWAALQLRQELERARPPA